MNAVRSWKKKWKSSNQETMRTFSIFAVIVLLRIFWPCPMILEKIVFTLMTFKIYFMVCWALNISLRVLLLRQFQTVFSTLKVIHGKFMMIKEESTLLSYVIPAC